MATKQQPVYEPVAVVEGRYLLPVNDAIQLLTLLAKAQILSRDYVSGRGYVYKLQRDQNTDFTFTTLTLAQAAAIHLED